MAKKIVLFIVEGISEKNALGPILAEIIPNNIIRFEVTHGDITSNYRSTNKKIIINKIESRITSFLTKRSFHLEDLLEVIFITDTDGTFIKKEHIDYHSKNRVIYKDDKILTKYKRKIQKRNKIKSYILNKISKVSYLTIKNKKIKFQVFYMSCNLDHILYNERNLGRKKALKALEFSDSYADKEKEFIDFIKRFMIDNKYNYFQSWQGIKYKNNSLLRYSNLWLYLKSYQ